MKSKVFSCSIALNLNEALLRLDNIYLILFLYDLGYEDDEYNTYLFDFMPEMNYEINQNSHTRIYYLYDMTTRSLQLEDFRVCLSFRGTFTLFPSVDSGSQIRHINKF